MASKTKCPFCGGIMTKGSASCNPCRVAQNAPKKGVCVECGANANLQVRTGLCVKCQMKTYANNQSVTANSRLGFNSCLCCKKPISKRDEYCMDCYNLELTGKLPSPVLDYIYTKEKF